MAKKKKKKVEVEPEIPQYQIVPEYTTSGGYTREPDPDDEWDAGDTNDSFHVDGFHLAKDRWGQFEVAFEPDHQTRYFLLYATYMTGSTFGSCNDIRFVMLYKDIEVAKENKRRLQHHNDIYDGYNSKRPKKYCAYTAVLIDEEGKEYDFIVPWHGYFERLENIEIEGVFMN